MASFEYDEFNGDVEILSFGPEIAFLDKFSPKNHNYLLKLKFGTWNNLSLLNSMVIFTFYILNWKYSFWANLIQKFKIIFKVKFGT